MRQAKRRKGGGCGVLGTAQFAGLGSVKVLGRGEGESETTMGKRRDRTCQRNFWGKDSLELKGA